jgi:hypothetical protein
MLELYLQLSNYPFHSQFVITVIIVIITITIIIITFLDVFYLRYLHCRDILYKSLPKQYKAIPPAVTNVSTAQCLSLLC